MDEKQRMVWVMSMPACADINEAMQELTEVKYVTSEQHKEASCARQERDLVDTQKVIKFLMDRNPFNESTTLHNIATGVVAHTSVNAEQAEQIGNDIIAAMVNQDVFGYSFKRKNQVVNMTASVVAIGKELIDIDPQLLFQRLVVVWEQYPNPAELFKYELCSYPPALFDESRLPRVANKAQFADSIWQRVKSVQTQPPGADLVDFVIDGGALLQRLPWQQGATYSSICESYVQYIERHFGKYVTVVFDGYQDGPSTKDPTHQRRRTKGVGPEVKLRANAIMNHKKDIFLSNDKNKQGFLLMLGEKLQRDGHTIHHATADVDLLIVTTALECAMTSDIVVIGDDTDLIVLLCYHSAEHSTNTIYLVTAKR